MKRVLGLDLFCHDGSACLVEDGRVRVAISEERLNRRKHSRGYQRAAQYCLNTAGLQVDDLDLVCVSHPYLSDEEGQQTLAAFQLLGVPVSNEKKLRFVNHYLCHVASAFYTSGYDEALVFVIDGHGSNGTELVTQGFYDASVKGLECLYSRSNRIGSLDVGFAFESVSYHLGFENEEFDSGKTMGLSAFGQYESGTREPLFWLQNDHVHVNPHYIRYHDVIRGTTRRVLNLGAKRNPPEPISQQHKDVAAFLQRESESILVERVRRMLRVKPARRLCLAGGVAMNGLIANRLRNELNLDEVFIPPMPNDAGTAVGAAFRGYAQLMGDHYEPSEQIALSAWGRDYPESTIETVTKEFPNLEHERCVTESELIEKVVDTLVDGGVVGWMCGRSEFGPRALGHRSILCDPRDKAMKDRVNERVKMREPFRPFAPAVMAEYSRQYFDFDGPSRFMCFIDRSTPLAKERAPAVVHEDGTARLQTVHEGSDGAFFRLLEAFHCRTGVPVLLNTSFNLAGEPIVETPYDAASTFVRSDMDLLVIEMNLFTKEGSPVDQ